MQTNADAVTWDTHVQEERIEAQKLKSTFLAFCTCVCIYTSLPVDVIIIYIVSVTIH